MAKTIIKTIIAAFLLPAFALSQEMTATDIVQKANDVLNQETVFTKAKMTIVTTSGDTRELFYDSWMKGRGEKNLIRYTAPRRIKDQALLMLNNADDIWSYFPRTNRVRKLATHAKKQKMQGDFSYEDFGSGNSFITNFSHRLLKDEKIEERDCYVVEFQKKENSDSNYSRMTVWIDKGNFIMWAIDYYDEKDTGLRLKTLIQSSVKVIDGVPTAMKITMRNHQDNTETVIELLEVAYNIDLDDGMFTERGLKK